MEAVLGHCAQTEDELRVLAKDADSKVFQAVSNIGKISLSSTRDLSKAEVQLGSLTSKDTN